MPTESTDAMARTAGAIEANPLGGSSRLAQLLTKLEKLLAERYAFDVFAEDSINFGIMVTYRQTWEPQQYQVGDLVEHDSARAQGDPPLHDAIGDEEDAGGEGARGQLQTAAKRVQRHDARRRRDRQEGAGEDELQHQRRGDVRRRRACRSTATQSGGGRCEQGVGARPRRNSARAC